MSITNLYSTSNVLYTLVNWEKNFQITPETVMRTCQIAQKCLVMSSRPWGQLPRRPDDQTLNADDVVWTAGGSWWTANAADTKCQKWVRSSCIRYAGALDCRYRCTVPQSLHCTHWETSSQCSSVCSRCNRPRSYACVSDKASSSIQYLLKQPQQVSCTNDGPLHTAQ